VRPHPVAGWWGKINRRDGYRDVFKVRFAGGVGIYARVIQLVPRGHVPLVARSLLGGITVNQADSTPLAIVRIPPIARITDSSSRVRSIFLVG